MELYVHIPFCRKKCRYCSFVSFTEKESDYEAYIDLLLKEAEWRADEAEEPVRTVYIGGGRSFVAGLSCAERLPFFLPGCSAD